MDSHRSFPWSIEKINSSPMTGTGYNAVTIKKNHAAAKHTNSNNRGHSYIIGLGN